MRSSNRPCWTVPRRPNPWCASSAIRCEALQHNVAQKKFTCVNNYSEAHIVAAPCVRWTHSKKDAAGHKFDSFKLHKQKKHKI